MTTFGPCFQNSLSQPFLLTWCFFPPNMYVKLKFSTWVFTHASVFYWFINHHIICIQCWFFHFSVQKWTFGIELHSMKMSWQPIASPPNHPKTTQSSLSQTIFYKQHKGLSILKGFRYSYKHPLFIRWGENHIGLGGRRGDGP